MKRTRYILLAATLGGLAAAATLRLPLIAQEPVLPVERVAEVNAKTLLRHDLAHVDDVTMLEYKRNPQQVEAEVAIRKDLKKLQGKLSEEQTEATRKSLIKNVALLFDAKQKQRLRELDEMEKELKRLRTVHERRETEKDKIVSDRVQQLIRETQGLGWGDTRVDDFIERENLPWLFSPLDPAAAAAAPAE